MAGSPESGKAAEVAGRVGQAPDTPGHPSGSAAGEVDSPRPRVHVRGGPRCSRHRSKKT